MDRLIAGTNRMRGKNPWCFEEYDSLPAAVRRAIMYASTSLGSRRARMGLTVGKSIAEVCAIERAVDRACTRRDILAAYGADHPFLTKGALHE